MKVFGIGLNKTGTTTLKVCLEKIGYKVKGCDLELTRCATKSNLESIYETVRQYDGFQDWPWPLVYEEIDQRYPNSKFILTTRSDSETWFQSLKKHANRTGPTEYRKLVYGHEMPHGRKEHHIEIYKRHNEEVLNYFKGRDDDLLTVCWETGTGWEELCGFLDADIPDVPLPHAKKSPDRKSYLQRCKEKAVSIIDNIRNK